MMHKKYSRKSTFYLIVSYAVLCCFALATITPMPIAAADAASQTKPVTEKMDEGLTLDNLIRVWLRIPALEHSNVGLEIMEIPTGKVLYSFNGNRRYTPASTTKAITAACAFDTFGGAYTYKTSVIAEGQLNGTVLNGNLVIVPSQDPTLTRAQLSALIKEAVQATARISGVGALTEITGQVKLAPTQAVDMGFHQSWLVEDWGRHWMPVSSNLVLDHNIANPLELQDAYRVVDAANTHGSLFHTLLNAPDGPTWIFMDRANRMALTYKPKHPQAPQQPSFSMANPDEYNLALAEQMVRRHGIRIGGQTTGPGGSVYQLAQHESAPLSNIIKTTLYESDNLYAQQLLRTLGAQTLKAEEKPSDKPSALSLEARGLLAMSRWLSKIGVNGQETILFDGCGLCRKNAVSPHALNTVIKYMAGEKANGPYLSLLKQNDESASGKGNYQFKTGTMDSVRAITGALTTAGSQHLALTIMVNGHTPSIRNLRIAQSALINQLRGIKQIGQAVPKVQAGAPSDPNIVESSHEKVVLDYSALTRSAKAKPAPQSRKKKSKRKH